MPGTMEASVKDTEKCQRSLLVQMVSVGQTVSIFTDSLPDSPAMASGSPLQKREVLEGR